MNEPMMNFQNEFLSFLRYAALKSFDRSKGTWLGDRVYMAYIYIYVWKKETGDPIGDGRRLQQNRMPCLLPCTLSWPTVDTNSCGPFPGTTESCCDRSGPSFPCHAAGRPPKGRRREKAKGPNDMLLADSVSMSRG